MVEHAILPRYLNARYLRGASVPAEWAPVLGDLAKLYDALVDKKSQATERRQEVRAIHERLLATPIDVVGRELPSELANGSPIRDHLFVEAVLIAMRLSDLATPGEILDTIPSSTLASFAVDIPCRRDVRELLRSALQRAFHMSAEELGATEERLDAANSGLRLKRRLAAELRRRLTCERPLPTPEERLVLMQQFYGAVPLRPEEVDLVIAGSAIFFCIPYKGDELPDADCGAHGHAEKEQLRTFLRMLQESNNAKNARFPAFGAFHREWLDPLLVAELTAALRQSPESALLQEEQVREALTMMVSILPIQLADQYLIHDVWGHGWQADLCDFAADYRRLTHVSAPLTPDSGPYFGGGGACRLRDAFFIRDGATHVDEQRLLQFAETDLCGRVLVTFNSFAAEMLADLMEAKFIHQVYSDPASFPSSSLLPEEPIKLDLAMEAYRESIAWWRQPYVDLASRPEERQRLVDELQAIGFPRPGLVASVALASERMVQRFAMAFEDQPLSARQEGRGDRTANLFEWLMLKTVSVGKELRPYFQAAPSCVNAPRWAQPERSIDLLVILMGWFFKHEQTSCYWYLDSLVRDVFPSELSRLRDELMADASVKGWSES